MFHNTLKGSANTIVGEIIAFFRFKDQNAVLFAILQMLVQHSTQKWTDVNDSALATLGEGQLLFHKVVLDVYCAFAQIDMLPAQCNDLTHAHSREEKGRKHRKELRFMLGSSGEEGVSLLF